MSNFRISWHRFAHQTESIPHPSRKTNDRWQEVSIQPIQNFLMWPLLTMSPQSYRQHCKEEKKRWNNITIHKLLDCKSLRKLGFFSRATLYSLYVPDMIQPESFLLYLTINIEFKIIFTNQIQSIHKNLAKNKTKTCYSTSLKPIFRQIWFQIIPNLKHRNTSWQATASPNFILCNHFFNLHTIWSGPTF